MRKARQDMNGSTIPSFASFASVLCVLCVNLNLWFQLNPAPLILQNISGAPNIDRGFSVVHFAFHLAANFFHPHASINRLTSSSFSKMSSGTMAGYRHLLSIPS